MRRYRASVELDVPLELESGVFAETLTVWRTPHHLVLDFGAPTDGEHSVATARVRVPATAALDVLGQLGEGIREYELQYGEIHRPRPRGPT